MLTCYSISSPARIASLPRMTKTGPNLTPSYPSSSAYPDVEATPRRHILRNDAPPPPVAALYPFPRLAYPSHSGRGLVLLRTVFCSSVGPARLLYTAPFFLLFLSRLVIRYCSSICASHGIIRHSIGGTISRSKQVHLWAFRGCWCWRLCGLASGACFGSHVLILADGSGEQGGGRLEPGAKERERRQTLGRVWTQG